MHFIHSNLINVILLPLIIYALDQNVDHNKDLYFEVIEPCMSFHLHSHSKFYFHFFLADISYTFRSRPASDFGTNFVS
jgi:hypothetical protein